MNIHKNFQIPNLIILDSQGRFWLGGWKGLFRFSEDQAKENNTSFYHVGKYGPWD
ncbi:hypothetical protein [Mangrovimonas sp. TPBH4]|uniref:hypothetical protein n=1 Tax=Mangrovimonas sp. TPBH4 TaxID=1645914 RepID=UPI0012F91DC0|nr:hypothetical protein [Mangrovimonas sp. TPBH4]